MLSTSTAMEAIRECKCIWMEVWEECDYLQYIRSWDRMRMTSDSNQGSCLAEKDVSPGRLDRKDHVRQWLSAIVTKVEDRAKHSTKRWRHIPSHKSRQNRFSSSPGLRSLQTLDEGTRDIIKTRGQCAKSLGVQGSTRHGLTVIGTKAANRDDNYSENHNELTPQDGLQFRQYREISSALLQKVLLQLDQKHTVIRHSRKTLGVHKTRSQSSLEFRKKRQSFPQKHVPLWNGSQGATLDRSLLVRLVFRRIELQI